MLNAIVGLLLLVLLLLIYVVVAIRGRGPDATGGTEVTGVLREELRASRTENATLSRELRQELVAAQSQAQETLRGIQETFNRHALEQVRSLQELTDGNRNVLNVGREDTLRQLTDMQRGTLEKLEQMRATLDERLHKGQTDLLGQVKEVTQALKDMQAANTIEQQKSRETLDAKLRELQASNEQKLELMRMTVDEKLQSTLEKRLGESFKQVSERLEAVQKGLGEMQSLAAGVGDLKRVLTNVKERGTWAEYQLGDILDQFLTQAQYERNFSPRNDGTKVEFAVKMPGRKSNADVPVWLPIDAKFPKEDYERLVDASQRADAEAVAAATKALGNAVRKAAQDIASKYITPPVTTEFAILFLPTEGLYAEVLRQPGLQDDIMNKLHVMIAGPTTLSAILSSLRVGFQSVAIEQRAKEIWDVLGAVKQEFSKYGDMLDKLTNQLNTASKTVEETKKRTRIMQKKLTSVEQLEDSRAEQILQLGTQPDPDEE